MCTVFLSSYRNTSGSLGEREMLWKHEPWRQVFPQLFRVVPNFHQCFYNWVETRWTFFNYCITKDTTNNKTKTAYKTTNNALLILPTIQYFIRVQLLHYFRVLPNFHKCFYNSIETRRPCFLFLLENTIMMMKKGKRLVDYQNVLVNSLCLHHHNVESSC